MDTVPVKAVLPLVGIGALTLCLSFCFCCYLWWLRRQGRRELGYRQVCYIIEFKKKQKKVTSEVCPVCLDDYKPGDKLALCNCKHAFHAKCLQQWLNESNTCPLCKAPVQDEPCENTSLVHSWPSETV